MTNKPSFNLSEDAESQKRSLKAPRWVWGLFVILLAVVGYQWLRKPQTRLYLTGKHSLFWFSGAKLYLGDTSDQAQVQLWAAPQEGGTLQKALALPHALNLEGTEITPEGVYAFTLLDHEEPPSPEEIMGPTEYQVMMGGPAFFRRITRHIEGNAWAHYLWPGFTNVMHRNLTLFSWDGKQKTVDLGRKQARPVDYVQTPEYFFWVNANPVEYCYHNEGGRFQHIGNRGKSELVMVDKRTGKAETLARDLNLMTKNSALATDGESVYWLDLLSVGYEKGRFIPRTGVRLCRYSPRTKQKTTLQEFEGSAGFVALPKMPMLLHNGRIYCLLSYFVRSPVNASITNASYTAFSCDTNGQNIVRRDFDISGGTNITYWMEAQGKIGLAYKTGNRFTVAKIDLEKPTPLETLYRSPQDDSAEGIGFGKEGFFYRQWIQSEHWGKWSAKDLEIQWETRIFSHPIAF